MDGQGKPWLTPADALTSLRLPLAVLFPLVSQPGVRLAIIGVAAASDIFDGILARRYGGSRTGAVLDPVADKIFVASAFLTLWRSGLLVWWEIVGILLRDVVAVAGALTVWLRHRSVALPARAGGKAVTVGQVLTLVAFVAESPLVRPLAWATAAVSVYALWDYGRAAARVTEDS
jgi:CDP-diacylglycerol--glycerol-3-phosphate 3-phosphatidyltransferase/cardiolipin synthase